MHAPQIRSSECITGTGAATVAFSSLSVQCMKPDPIARTEDTPRRPAIRVPADRRERTRNPDAIARRSTFDAIRRMGSSSSVALGIKFAAICAASGMLAMPAAPTRQQNDDEEEVYAERIAYGLKQSFRFQQGPRGQKKTRHLHCCT
ncbi:hypothetical protein ZWY2020_049387 [Hordeum vulgare]|nr:hypothetical protein ZWY2020_049387 [Hordeum vulgare]